MDGMGHGRRANPSLSRSMHTKQTEMHICVETKALIATWYSKPGHRERVGGTPNIERATNNEPTVRRWICLAVSPYVHSNAVFNLYLICTLVIFLTGGCGWVLRI